MSEPTRQEVEVAVNREPFVYYGKDITGDTRTISADTHDVLLAAARAWVDQEITDNMVERAAKAMVDFHWGTPRHDVQVTNADREKARVALQAALTRSDEPTDDQQAINMNDPEEHRAT